MDRINNPALNPSLQAQTGGQFVGNLFSAIIGTFFIVGGIAIVFIILISGLQWMLAGGDKAAVESARGRLTSGIIGLLILFSTWAIIKLIENFVGFEILGEPIILPSLIP